MKQNVRNLFECADEFKKVNPMDLFADQDLTIALMNLVAIEDLTPNSQIGEMVCEIREKLMSYMVSDKDTQAQAREHLSQGAYKRNEANRFQKAGNRKKAYELYDASYEAYILYLATVYGISA